MQRVGITQIELARLSETAPRTVARYARGEAIRPASLKRITRALASLGLLSDGADLDDQTRRALGLDSGEAES